MMFDAFHVPGNRGGVESQQAEELDEYSPPMQLPFGGRRPFRREREAAITLVVQEAALAEMLHHRGDAGLLDAQSGGNIHHARVAFGSDKFSDACEAILSAGGQRARTATRMNAH